MTEKEVNKTVGVVMASLLPQNEKRELIDSIRAMEKETKNNGWIPCSERLPEENGLYLVCYENLNCYPSKCLFLNGKFNDTHILAWQPLPEPYREEQEDGR